ncbi:MAG: DUF1987 domain-containing protein [Sphingobacteriaceae bacterium]|nr:DUF1987 domain-containing protein [Sphingobacteriaceae bacterium]
MMESLHIEATDDTPKISFNPQNGMMEISSRSLPENAGAFYDKVNNWFKVYLNHAHEKTTVKFHFDYISTSSAKQLIQLFNSLNQLAKSKKVDILWCYDQGDSDMLQTGQRLQKLSEVEFQYQEI